MPGSVLNSVLRPNKSISKLSKNFSLRLFCTYFPKSIEKSTEKSIEIPIETCQKKVSHPDSLTKRFKSSVFFVVVWIQIDFATELFFCDSHLASSGIADR